MNFVFVTRDKIVTHALHRSRQKKNAELEDALVFQQVLRSEIKGNVKQSVKEND